MKIALTRHLSLPSADLRPGDEGTYLRRLEWTERGERKEAHLVDFGLPRPVGLWPGEWRAVEGEGPPARRETQTVQQSRLEV